MYPDGDVTNVSLKFQIAELVREKILRLTKDEVPHTVTCYTETLNENPFFVDIGVLIIVDRDNLKKIIIGKNGQLLKEVGIKARRDIEELVGKKVNLKTYVKTIDSWRDKQKYLREFGLDELNE